MLRLARSGLPSKSLRMEGYQVRPPPPGTSVLLSGVGSRGGKEDESLAQQMHYSRCKDCLDYDPDELMRSDRTDLAITRRRHRKGPICS